MRPPNSCGLEQDTLRAGQQLCNVPTQNLTYYDTKGDRYCTEQNMTIECDGQIMDLPSKRTRTDTNDCQFLNCTASLSEARLPHIFKDGGCNENVA